MLDAPSASLTCTPRSTSLSSDESRDDLDGVLSSLLVMAVEVRYSTVDLKTEIDWNGLEKKSSSRRLRLRLSVSQVESKNRKGGALLMHRPVVIWPEMGVGDVTA